MSILKKSSKTLDKLFERIVNVNKDEVILFANDANLTYGELNCKANCVANNLIHNGLNIGDRVIINLNRDSNLIYSILGVVKAGGVFILTKPDFPIERTNFLIKDSGAKFIIVNNDFKYDKNFNTKIIYITSIFNQLNTNYHNPSIDLISSDIFSIMYTSGSTGEPKGVILTHEALINNVIFSEYNSITSVFLNNNINSYLLSTAVSYTPFYITLFLCLLNDISIVFANEEVLQNPKKLFNLFNKANFKSICTVPSFIQLYLDNKDFHDLINQLKIIILAGEKLNSNLVRKIYEINKNIRLYNSYGTTETMFSNIKLIKENDKVISVGKPLLNVLEMVVDINGNNLSPDFVGELWVGGLSLGKGYWNNNELTNEKFIKFNGIPYFKTGDLAKYDNNGDYFILGRVDDQLKLHGQRIESDEIINNLPLNCGLKESVARIQKINNENVLSLYFTTKDKLMDNNRFDFKKIIRDELQSKLPIFMVPQIYVYLDEFPKTVSGKIDVMKLPRPKFTDLFINDIVLPENDIEKNIWGFCSEILGFDDFGVTNSLLSIGFTSLSFIKLSLKILEKYSVEINLSFLLKTNVSIRSISYDILNQSSKKNNENSMNNEKYEKRELYPLTYQQIGFLSINKKLLDDANNMPFCISFKPDYFDIYKIKDALTKTIEVNPYIKTYFIKREDRIYQKRNDNCIIDISIYNEELSENIKNNFVKPFDLFEKPLFHFELYYYFNEIFLLMDVHHILGDDFSMKIFFKDFNKIYNGKNVNNKNFDYFDYVLESFNNNSKLIEDINHPKFYKNYLKNFEQDYESSNFNESIKFKEIYLNTEDIEKFLENNEILLSNFFLSALILTISDFLKTENVFINNYFNGRNEIKYSNVFGFFATFLPLRFKINKEMLIKDFLDYVKNTFLEFIENPLNSQAYMINKYEKRNINITYNFMNDEDLWNDDNIKIEPLRKIKNNQNKSIKNNELYFLYSKLKHNLKITIIYSSSHYDEKKIKNLIGLIKYYSLNITNFSIGELKNFKEYF
ncbi:MAG: AMP-binding protein [Methanobrevibacter sp.]|jgi:amino acid adenylation domain-containing protein|nr:AMP-binding protein [Methanobrevibacter sp.]